jgi:hypothetical protein
MDSAGFDDGPAYRASRPFVIMIFQAWLRCIPPLSRSIPDYYSAMPDPAPSPRGKQIGSAMRAGLLTQFEAIYAEVDEAYPAFLAEAKTLLPDRASSPRFGFIIRRLWFEDVGELADNWQEALRTRYDSFEAAFDWTVPPGTSASPELVARTLSVWQRRYLTDLRVRHALDMITTVQAALG